MVIDVPAIKESEVQKGADRQLMYSLTARPDNGLRSQGIYVRGSLLREFLFFHEQSVQSVFHSYTVVKSFSLSTVT